MNHHELEMVSGWFRQSGDTTDQLKFVQDHYKIPQIIVTRGADGAMALDDGKIYEHPGYEVKVKDTIGSGNSFFAGYLSKILNGEGVEKAIDFAAGTVAFVATKAGGCPEYEVEEINDLMKKSATQPGK